MKKIALPIVLILIAVLNFTACKKEPVVSNPTPYLLTMISGNAQTDTVNNQLGEAFVVQVRDSSGAGLAGVAVTFSIATGGGTLTQPTVSTNADGFAENILTLGSVAGSNTVSVTAAVSLGSPNTFNADALSRTFIDARDGREYRTLRVANQEWMADNLGYNATGSFLNPANPSADYGRLYDWATVMDGANSSNAVPSGVTGICPAGWHLPSDEEWLVLERAWDFTPDVLETYSWRGPGAAEMKSANSWPPSDSTANNAFGFNALPAGIYGQPAQGPCCVFMQFGTATGYWTTTEYNSTLSIIRDLDASYSFGVGRHFRDRATARSCRCVKD
jgi:uncharacterized protein (TIGR02145 family)